MIPTAWRIRDSQTFRDVVRQGKRYGGKYCVVHSFQSTDDDVLVGFVVSKAVGNAVARNRVKRRLRHIMADLPLNQGARIVVRALPRAQQATFSELSSELTKQLTRCNLVREQKTS